VSILNLGVGIRSQAAPSIVPSMLTSAKQIDKLSLWFDASKITIAAGQPVTQWNDLSGNNKHATQSTIANQPIMQNGGVYFNYSASNYLTFPAANAKTVIFAIKITRQGWNSIITQGYSVDYGIRTSSSGGVFPLAGNANDYAGPNGATNIFIDGSQKATFTTGTKFVGSFYQNSGDVRQLAAMGVGYIGDNRSLGGELYEIIAYDKVLTAKERKQVEKYLGRKWGVTIAP
jgi:hypothetical protein